MSPWRGSYSTGLATEDAYLTNSESDSETLPYGPMATLTVDGYFDVNTNGVQDAGDIDYSSITPLAVPDDCPPTSTEPVDSSEPPSSDPTTTSTTHDDDPVVLRRRGVGHHLAAAADRPADRPADGGSNASADAAADAAADRSSDGPDDDGIHDDHLSGRRADPDDGRSPGHRCP